VRDATGAERKLAEHGDWPRWSPDGRWIAFTSSNPEGGRGEIFVIRPDGGDQRRLSSGPSQVYGLCWTPDARWLIYGCDIDGTSDLWITTIDKGEPVQITRGPAVSDSPAVSADGRRLIFCSGKDKSGLYIAAGPGKSLRRILSQLQVHAFALSPDGRRLALILGGLSRGYSLSVYDIETGSLRTVSALKAEEVAWTPDSTQLVVTAPSPDGAAVWVWRLPLDGGLPEPLVRGTQRWKWPDLSPDGRWLSGSRCTDNGCELVVVELETGRERVLNVAAEQFSPRWSPNGRFIAWSSSPRPIDSHSAGIWVAEVEQAQPRRLAPDGAWITWEPDSKSIDYARYTDDSGLWRVTLDGGEAEPIQIPDDSLWDHDVGGLQIARESTTMVVRFETWTLGLYVLDDAVDEGG